MSSGEHPSSAPVPPWVYGPVPPRHAPPGQPVVPPWWQPGYQPGSQPPPPPARRPPPRRRRRGLLAAVSLVVAVAVGLTGGLVAAASLVGGLGPQATWRAGQPSSQPNQVPASGAPASEWSSWARRSIGDALSVQAAALLTADEPGYLSVVDPANAELVADHKRRFKVLRAMSPGVWSQTVAGPLTSKAALAWSVEVKISHCFGDPTCRPSPVLVSTGWQFKNDRLVLTSLGHASKAWNGPRPWETDDLAVVVTDRVVLASGKANVWRLRSLLLAADRAAKVADRFARWQPAPSRFVVFLAEESEWSRWYGAQLPAWAGGWTVPVGPTTSEVMLRNRLEDGSLVPSSELESLLEHEFTHVTSLAGDRAGDDAEAWWLVEGIADYATMIGRPVQDYEKLPFVRQLVRRGWDGDPVVTPPDEDTSLAQAAGRYGIAFLTVRRIADRYGETAMITLFGRVVHDNMSLDAATRATIDVSWSSVKTDCTKFIRSVAN